MVSEVAPGTLNCAEVVQSVCSTGICVMESGTVWMVQMKRIVKHHAAKVWDSVYVRLDKLSSRSS